jgi:30S ribosomal protein S31
MGKGDKKSRRGKIAIGSYGITRPRNKKSTYVAAASSPAASEAKAEKKPKAAAEKPAAKKAPAKKAAAKKAAKES